MTFRLSCNGADEKLNACEVDFSLEELRELQINPPPLQNIRSTLHCTPLMSFNEVKVFQPVILISSKG